MSQTDYRNWRLEHDLDKVCWLTIDREALRRISVPVCSIVGTYAAPGSPGGRVEVNRSAYGASVSDGTSGRGRCSPPSP